MNKPDLQTALINFFTYVEEFEDEKECWMWKGCTDGWGYGSFSGCGISMTAHRWIYTVFRGQVPKGYQLHHVCEIKLCVNPLHLEAVTRREHLDWHIATKSECSKGHPYVEGNIYYSSDGRRKCATCVKARQLAYNERKRNKLND